MDITNLGSMAANVQMTADTSEVERAITNMTAQANRQFSELGDKTLTDLTNNFRGFTTVVTDGLGAINQGIAKIQNIAGLGILGAGIGGVVNQIYQTRQFFQDTESTMMTFFKSADKSKQFISDLKDYAYYNMYEFSDLVTVSKQLIAYGTTETKDIIRVTDQLSNIATGTGANINEMVGIYNKIKATGKANGLVLQQLASRGLVVKDVLKEMGENVAGNTITFSQFEKVIKHVTDEGGMFYNQMANQMDNLSASSGQLQDNLTAMYEEIGEELEPVFKSAIDFAGTLVDNYREIGDVLLDVAKVFGVYKVVSQGIEFNKSLEAEQKTKAFEQEKEALEKLSKEEEKYADLQERINKGDLTQEQAKELAALRDKLGEKENLLKKEKEEAETAIQETDKKIAANEKEIASLQAKRRELEALQNMSARSGDMAAYKEQGLQIAELTAQEQKLTATNEEIKATQKKTATDKLSETQSKLNELQTKREASAQLVSAKNTNVASKAKLALGKATSKLGKILDTMGLTNPYMLAIEGITMLISLTYKLATMQNAAEQAQQSKIDADAEAAKRSATEIAELNRYMSALKSATEGTQEYDTAKKNLMKKYPDYFSAVDEEMSKIGLLTGKYTELKEAIEAKNRSAAYEEAIKKNEEQIGENTEAVVKDFLEKAKDADVDLNSVFGLQLQEAFNKSLEGQSDEWIAQNYGREISEKLKEIKGDVQFEWGDLLYVSPLVVGTFLKDMYDASDATSALDFAQKALNGDLKMFGSQLEGDISKMQQTNAELEKMNGELAEQVRNIEASKPDTSWYDNWFGKSALGLPQEQIDEALNHLKGITMQAYQFGQDTKRGIDNAKEEIRKWQAYRNEWQRKQKEINKAILGDDYNTQQQKYKKQIDLYKNFASEYAKIEIKRQNELKKLNDSRNKKDANQAAIDLQVENLNRKTDDQLEKLYAKFYNVSATTAAQIRATFSNALGLPIDQAKERLLAVTKRIEQIKNAAANGDTIATREQQAMLEAERAALQQNIDLVEKEADEKVKALERITKLEKEQGEKFLTDEVRKQKNIKETYAQLRKELDVMLENGRISQEKYKELMDTLWINEHRESDEAYLEVYGNTSQRLEKITREWNEKLANIPDEYLRVARKQMEQNLAELNFENFKDAWNWDRIFEDFAVYSSETLVGTIDQLEAEFEKIKDTLTLKEIEEFRNAINTLNDELANRNPWLSVKRSLDTLKNTKSVLPKLQKEEQTALEKLNKATAERNRLLAEKERLQDSETDEDRLKLLQVNEELEQAEKDLTEATDDYRKKQAETIEEIKKRKKAEEDLYGSLSKISGYVSQAGDAFTQLGDAMGESGDNMRELGDALSSLGSTFQSTFDAIKSGDKGSIISSAASNIVNMVSTIVASRKKFNAEQKQWKLAQARFADNMQLAEIEKVRTQNQNKNIFYNDYNAQADDAVKAYKLAQDKLSAQIDKLEQEGKAKKGQRGGIDWGATGKAAASGAGAGAAIGSFAGPIGTAIGAVVGGVAGFIGGLFGGKKKKDIWGGLLTEFPELVEMGVDGEERINTALAEQLIEQGMVNDETKEMIEGAMKYQEEMDAARQEITDIVSQLTGDLGNNLMDALVEAFKAGEDSAEAFGNTVDAVLENMIKKLIFNAAFSQYFDKLQDKYEKIFMSGANEANKVTMLMNATKEFKDEASAGVGVMNEFMRQASEYGDKLGMNIFKVQEEEERKAVSGGITNMTQDTAEELNGRMTQIQSHTFGILENQKLMVSMQTTQLTILQGIHSDTAQLHGIRADIAELKATVSDIQIKGLKMK